MKPFHNFLNSSLEGGAGLGWLVLLEASPADRGRGALSPTGHTGTDKHGWESAQLLRRHQGPPSLHSSLGDSGVLQEHPRSSLPSGRLLSWPMVSK